MARLKEILLDQGDMFPPMMLMTTDGNRINLPKDYHGSWTVLLVYRGHW